MKRSEFELRVTNGIPGHESLANRVATLAIEAGAEFEPEEPEVLRLVMSLKGASPPVVMASVAPYADSKRPLTTPEAHAVVIWWNARARIEAALVWPLACATPAEGSPCGVLIETLKAALSESEIR